MKNTIETTGQAQEIIKNLKKKIGNQKGTYLVLPKKLYKKMKKTYQQVAKSFVKK